MNNDLISRSELIKALEPYRFAICGFEGVLALIDNAPTVEAVTVEHHNRIKGILQNEIDSLVKIYDSERPQGEWIPASERLPDDMQRVLIWFEYYRYGDFNCMYQTYGFGYVCDGKWSPFINGETGWQDYNIIAWQPLPKPYEKGGAE